MAHVLLTDGFMMYCECGQNICAMIPYCADSLDCVIAIHRQHVLYRQGLSKETLEKFGLFACQHSSPRFGVAIVAQAGAAPLTP